MIIIPDFLMRTEAMASGAGLRVRAPLNITLQHSRQAYSQRVCDLGLLSVLALLKCMQSGPITSRHQQVI